MFLFTPCFCCFFIPLNVFLSSQKVKGNSGASLYFFFGLSILFSGGGARVLWPPTCIRLCVSVLNGLDQSSLYINYYHLVKIYCLIYRAKLNYLRNECSVDISTLWTNILKFSVGQRFSKRWKKQYFVILFSFFENGKQNDKFQARCFGLKTK